MSFNFPCYYRIISGSWDENFRILRYFPAREIAWESFFYRLVSPSDNICQNKWSKLTKVNTNFHNFL